METNDIYCIVEIIVASHGRYDLQGLILVRSNNSDIVISANRCLIHIVREICFFFYPVGKPFDKVLIRVCCLVLIRIYEIYDITIFFIGIKNGLLVPFINCFISCTGTVTAPFGSNPCRHLPTQNTDLDIRVDLLRISCHDKSRRAGSIRFFVLITHGTGFCSGRIISVISHFHLDMGKQRIFSSEKILHHVPVLIRMLCLVIQQQVTGTVTI